MGSGKTTLAHRLAGSVGCPAICRGLAEIVAFINGQP
jgi:adenylate kinase family enzyme